MAIKAVIFDLNGVFVTSQKLSERFRDYLGVPEAQFLPVLESALGKMRLPNAGDGYAYFEPHLKAWGVALPPRLFWNFWLEPEEAVPEIAGLVERVRDHGAKVVILSNNFKERTDYYDHRFPFLRALTDAVYYSWQTGFVKSDPRAYQKILTDFNLAPQDVLFFDDSTGNVAVAKGLGINAYMFQGIDGVREVLKQHLGASF